MNKRIKKKHEKQYMLKLGFTEEAYKYITKYPRLYPIASTKEIKQYEIDRIYNKLKFKYSKDEFQINYHMFLINPNALRIREFVEDLNKLQYNLCFI